MKNFNYLTFIPTLTLLISGCSMQNDVLNQTHMTGQTVKSENKVIFAGSQLSKNQSNIYTVNTDGSNLVQLTHDNQYNNEPSISPNKEMIAYCSDYKIVLMKSDGSEQREIAKGCGPTWSPDGKSIAYYSYQDGNWEIYVMNADGTNQHNISNNPRTDTYPSWSPDGKYIAFHTTRDGKDDSLNTNWEIYRMNADGTNQTRLTNNRALDWIPTWSPDGKTLAFWSTRDGNWELYLMNNDGSNQRKITNSSGARNEISRASWSPDGNTIAFVATHDKDSLDIYKLNLIKNSTTRLPLPLKYSYDPQWFK